MQKMIAGEAASWPAFHTCQAFHTLEMFVRARVQEFIQQLLEGEVAELLGRTKSERRASIGVPPGSRNGHGKPRELALMSGTITVRRPRGRDVEERFVSRLLPLFQRRTQEVAALLPELLTVPTPQTSSLPPSRRALEVQATWSAQLRRHRRAVSRPGGSYVRWGCPADD